MNWIKVSDKLPDQNGFYLVWAPRYCGPREVFDGGITVSAFRKNYRVP